MVLRLIVSGAAGRMGARIIDLASKDPAFELLYGLESASQSSAAPRIPTGSDRARIKDADVVVDFSAPQASVALAAEMARYKKPWVIGTTGFTKEDEAIIRETARQLPVLLSPNMSLGVNALFKLAGEAAKILSAYDVEIIEAHHIHKKDAPSGTALRAGRIIEEASGRKVKYESVREGEIVGDHRIIFKGVGERFELFHHAESRDTFAAGALQAAKWLVNQRPGFYSMRDVLGL